MGDYRPQVADERLIQQPNHSDSAYFEPAGFVVLRNGNNVLMTFSVEPNGELVVISNVSMKEVERLECGLDVDEGWCADCGEVFDIEDLAQVDDPGDDDLYCPDCLVTCEECGEVFRWQELYCPECQAEVEEADEAVESQ